MFGLILGAPLDLSHAQSAVANPHVRGAIAAAPGAKRQSLRIRITLDVSPGWHIGAPHNGTRDLPTRLAWHLPAGWKISNTRWPRPTRVIADRETTFTYSGRVAIDAVLEANDLTDQNSVGVVVSYGVCRDVCIPGRMSLGLSR